MASKDQPVDELDKLFDATINFKQAAVDFAADAELFGDNDSVLATANVKLEEYRKVFKAEIAKLCQAECNRARIEQTEFIRDEWAKWLQFPEDKDEMKISDLVNHCNILIDELQQLLKGASDEPKSM